MTTQLTVKRDFVHSEIGARADLRMDKVTLRVWGHPHIEVRRFAYAAPLPHPETFSAADSE